MYQITLPIEMNGPRYGIQFKRSVGYTDDERIADVMRSKGFGVELMEETAGEGNTPPPVKSPEEMTVPELKAFAAEKGIDLDGKTKKDDILAAILQAMEESAGDGE